MRPGESLYLFFFKKSVQQTAGAAVRIANIDTVVVVPGLIDLFLDCSGDFFRMVVKVRTKALEVDVVPAVESLQRGDFVGKGAARNDQARAWFFPGKAKDSEVC